MKHLLLRIHELEVCRAEGRYPDSYIGPRRLIARVCTHRLEVPYLHREEVDSYMFLNPRKTSVARGLFPYTTFVAGLIFQAIPVRENGVQT